MDSFHMHKNFDFPGQDESLHMYRDFSSSDSPLFPSQKWQWRAEASMLHSLSVRSKFGSQRFKLTMTKLPNDSTGAKAWVTQGGFKPKGEKLSSQGEEKPKSIARFCSQHKLVDTGMFSLIIS